MRLGTVPPRGRGGGKDGLKVVVAGADEDGTFELGGHRLTPADEDVTAVAQGLQHPTDSPAAHDHRRRQGGGCHHRGSPNPSSGVGGEVGDGGDWSEGKPNGGSHLGGGGTSS